MRESRFKFPILLVLSAGLSGCAGGPGLEDLGSAVRIRASTLRGASDGLHVAVLIDGLRSLELGYELCPELGISMQANGIAMTQVGTAPDNPCGTWEFYISASDLAEAQDVALSVRDQTGASHRVRLWAPFVAPELVFQRTLVTGATVAFGAVPSTHFLIDSQLHAFRPSESVEIPFAIRDETGGMMFIPEGLSPGTWDVDLTQNGFFPRPFRVEVVECEFYACEAVWGECGTEPCLQPEFVGGGPNELGTIEVTP